QAYHVTAATGQQVATELVLDIDLLDDDTPANKIAKLFHLHRAALKRQTIDDVWVRRAATSPNAIAGVLFSEPVLDQVRREVRRRTGVNPAPEILAAVIRDEVLRPGLL